MLYTSYFDRINDFQDNYLPISICLKIPEWYTGVQFQKLAPSPGLLSDYKQNHNAIEYIYRYQKEVFDKYVADLIIDEIYGAIPDSFKMKIASQKCDWYNNPEYHIVLLCYEEPSEFCHRHLVAEWFKASHIPCDELLID